MYRLPIEIACVLYLAYKLFEECSAINAAREQRFKHKFSARRRGRTGSASCKEVYCEGCSVCCSSGWDCFDLTAYASSLLGILGSWAAAIITPLFSSSREEVVVACIENGNCWSWGRAASNMLLIFMAIFTVLQIVGVFKYTRYHEGMRVYTMLFHESWKTLRDFIPWFLLLMVTQAWFICIVYSAVGANGDMIRFTGSLSVILVSYPDTVRYL